MDRLIGEIQHYDWGDPSFIASLQSRPPSGEPEAELWLGAHDRAPSRLELADSSLVEAIAADPIAALGEATMAAGFDGLPFLVKILAAARPLSIQAHPSLAQARRGFDREHRAGVAVDARDRIYRDPNHKPELICALTPFEAKCGFRSVAESAELFAGLGRTVAPVCERLAASGPDAEVLHQTVAWLLGLAADDAGALVNATLAAGEATTLSVDHQRELDWSAEIAGHQPGDIGAVLVLLLNHVRLEPGEALFLGAGNLHAYLRGSGVEVMANSDNVVRGGLTTKHVDVDELLTIVDCTPIDAPIQRPTGARHLFDAPVDDFDVERRVVDRVVSLEVGGPEIVVATAGALVARASGDGRNGATGGELELSAGDAVWVPADTGTYQLTGSGTVFRCSVGGAFT